MSREGGPVRDCGYRSDFFFLGEAAGWVGGVWVSRRREWVSCGWGIVRLNLWWGRERKKEKVYFYYFITITIIIYRRKNMKRKKNDLKT